MDLVLNMIDPPEGLASVTVDIRIDDQSEADAPARNLARHTIGPVAVRGGRVRLSLPAVTVGAGPRPAINLRVTGTTAEGQPHTFMNTTEIGLPSSDTEVITADVFRI